MSDGEAGRMTDPTPRSGPLEGCLRVVHAFVGLWMQFGTLLGSSKCKRDDVSTSIQRSKGANREIQKGPSAWKRACTPSW